MRELRSAGPLGDCSPRGFQAGGQSLCHHDNWASLGSTSEGEEPGTGRPPRWDGVGSSRTHWFVLRPLAAELLGTSHHCHFLSPKAIFWITSGLHTCLPNLQLCLTHLSDAPPAKRNGHKMTGLMAVMGQTIPGRVLKKVEEFLPGFLRKKPEQKGGGEARGPGAGMDMEAGVQPFPEAVLEPALGGGQSGRSASGRPRADPSFYYTCHSWSQAVEARRHLPPLPLPSPPSWLQQGE